MRAGISHISKEDFPAFLIAFWELMMGKTSGEVFKEQVSSL
jgi:hypothetical protein